MGSNLFQNCRSFTELFKTNFSMQKIDKAQHKTFMILFNIQSNPSSNGSFTMLNSNSFFSPYEILPTAQENKYLGKFSHFIIKLYVMCTH